MSLLLFCAYLLVVVIVTIRYYLAEFFSAMSSIPIVLYGWYFLHQTKVHGHGWRIGLSSVGVMIIGAGSFAFHGTMQRWGQVCCRDLKLGFAIAPVVLSFSRFDQRYLRVGGSTSAC